MESNSSSNTTRFDLAKSIDRYVDGFKRIFMITLCLLFVNPFYYHHHTIKACTAWLVFGRVGCERMRDTALNFPRSVLCLLVMAINRGFKLAIWEV